MGGGGMHGGQRRMEEAVELRVVVAVGSWVAAA